MASPETDQKSGYRGRHIFVRSRQQASGLTILFSMLLGVQDVIVRGQGLGGLMPEGACSWPLLPSSSLFVSGAFVRSSGRGAAVAGTGLGTVPATGVYPWHAATRNVAESHLPLPGPTQLVGSIAPRCLGLQTASVHSGRRRVDRTLFRQGYFAEIGSSV